MQYIQSTSPSIYQDYHLSCFSRHHYWPNHHDNQENIADSGTPLYSPVKFKRIIKVNMSTGKKRKEEKKDEEKSKPLQDH